MQLDRVRAVIRPRSYRESIDLGFRMVRAWYRPIYVAWFAALLPLLAFLVLAAPTRPWVTVLVVWWLKPLLDRIPLHVISRALFGPLPSARETLRDVLRMPPRTAFAPLTWMRLDPLRALRLPVWQLEGLKGRFRSARFRLLARGAGRDAALLIAACTLFEWTLALAPMAFVWMLISDPRLVVVDPQQLPLIAGALWLRWLFAGCYVLAVTLLEPFYVAAGFSLYINRRTHLEAWDVEVAFRRIAARLGRMAALALLLVGFGLFAAPPLHAQETEAPREVIDRVLADPVFGGERVEQYRKLKWEFDRDEEQALSGGGALVGGVLGVLVKWGLIALAVAVVVYGVLRGLMLIGDPRPERAAAPEVPPQEVLGLDVRRESLPEDLAGAARAAWRAGDRTGALRLLYRGSLSRLIERGTPIKDSSTEGECLRLARPQLADRGYGYLARLTREWQHAAYGHRDPADDAGELIDGWAEHFGAAA